MGSANGDEVVDAAQRGEHLRPVVEGGHRAAGALQGADAGVGVEADDEHVAERLRAVQQVDVPAVQQVEASVGEHDPPALALVERHPLRQRLGRHDVRGRGREVLAQVVGAAGRRALAAGHDGGGRLGQLGGLGGGGAGGERQRESGRVGVAGAASPALRGGAWSRCGRAGGRARRRRCRRGRASPRRSPRRSPRAAARCRPGRRPPAPRPRCHAGRRAGGRRPRRSWG